MSKARITVVGGGTGTYQVLTGLKKYEVDISAVISMADSGGSTGRLRKELGMLPPGDVRRAILALSDLPFARKTLEEVFDFRFKGGESLAGHSLGNILLAALVQITGSMDRAIEETARILNASGEVFPVTLDKTNLVAILADGERIYGEASIDKREKKLNVPIKKVYLNPKAKIFRKAADALVKADVIVLGPGDLYTSILPALLVEGVNEAIKKSKAKLVYVVNLMTKKEETKSYKASDFVSEIRKYLSDKNKLTHVVVNKKINGTKKEISSWYERYGSVPVEDDLGRNEGLKIIRGNFMDKTTFFRHDPQKIAKVVVGFLQ